MPARARSSLFKPRSAAHANGDRGLIEALASSKVFQEYERAFAEATGRRLPPFWKPDLDRTSEPVVGVSWSDAAAYAAWAGKRIYLKDGLIIKEEHS